MSRYRIPSVVAFVLGFLLIVYSDQLAGPKLPDGSRDERGFVIKNATSIGGVLICVISFAGMLYSARKGLTRRAAPDATTGTSSADS
jgi:hypothetical protein